MTISESGSVGGLPANASQTVPPRRNRIVAILCIAGSLILGGFGIAKTIAEHRELHYLYAIRELDQKTLGDIHRTAEGYESTIVGITAQSIEDTIQSSIDDTNRQIGQHRLQESIGGCLIAGGVALLALGIVLFRKRAKPAPIDSVNAAPGSELAGSGAESPLQPPAVAPEKAPARQFGAVLIGVGAVLAVVIIFAFLIAESNAPSSVASGDSSSTQPSAASAAPSTQSAPSQEPAASQGNWQLSSETNPVTGEVTTGASLDSPSDEEQYIVIRLIGKKLECYVNTNEFLETVENLESHISTVQYKFDDGKVVRQGWTLSSDNEALFYPGNCVSFIVQLRKAKTLAFEFRPSEKIPQTIIFDVEGFPEGFKAGK
jgi:invasion protein IalB